MKEDYDGAEPSANSISALNLLRLGRMLHDESFESRARAILASSREALTRAPTAVPKCWSLLTWPCLRRHRRWSRERQTLQMCENGTENCIENFRRGASSS